MNKLEWIVWGAGCVMLCVSLLLCREGKVMGRAAQFFSLCTAAALALTCFSNFSKMHLLWILPVTLLASGALAAWLGVRMMRRGLEQATANPEFQKAIREAMQSSKESSGIKSD